MTNPYHLHMAWVRVKQYGAAVIAAGLLFSGIAVFAGIAEFTGTSGLVWIINAIIRTGFRDRMLLGSYGFPPWQWQLTIAAKGIILIVVGFLIGLWVNSKKNRETELQAR